LIGYGNHDVQPPSENYYGGVAALDKKGNVIVDLRLPSSVKFLELGDVNNDGKNEILASCDCGKAYVIAAIPKPDLVAYYALENSFVDSSFYQNHGTAYGNPVFETGRSEQASDWMELTIVYRRLQTTSLIMSTQVPLWHG